MPEQPLTELSIMQDQLLQLSQMCDYLIAQNKELNRRIRLLESEKVLAHCGDGVAITPEMVNELTLARDEGEIARLNKEKTE